jgi:hypothetical protein
MAIFFSVVAIAGLLGWLEWRSWRKPLPPALRDHWTVNPGRNTGRGVTGGHTADDRRD